MHMLQDIHQVTRLKVCNGKHILWVPKRTVSMIHCGAVSIEKDKYMTPGSLYGHNLPVLVKV